MGPKGSALCTSAGAIRQVRLEPLFDGGGHERGLRSGTLPVPLVVGLGFGGRDCDARAAPTRRSGCSSCANGFTKGSRAGSRRSGSTVHPSDRLPGNLNLSFADVDGEALMMAMRDVAVSSGSACSSTNPEPSHVLLAMGLDEDMARASLRFGLGRFTTAEEIDFAIEAVAAAVAAAPRD